MTWEAWLTLGVVAGVFVVLTTTHWAADLVLLAGLSVLLLTGVMPVERAFAGFGNEGLVTVAVLFVVAAALRETGGMSLVANRLLGLPRTVRGAQVRLMLPVAALSAFMNNTPLVAMMLPVIDDWARKRRLPVSKLMIPLSYATILGGTCTLIGTSTNLVANGLLVRAGERGFGMFEIAWVGVPSAILGIGYVLLGSRWLLPDRRPAVSTSTDPREYTVEMLVAPGSALAGKTVEQAGLRQLPGAFLIEIDRDGEVIPAVGPDERLRGGDRLVFAGVLESVVDLQRTRGLVPATDQVFKLEASRDRRTLIEAVVSDTCPILGQSIRAAQFRSRYDAVVLAVARNGERLRQKIGDVVLRAGDTLLLEALPAFVRRQRDSRDFFLVSRVDDSAPRRHDRAWLALGILFAMVLAVTLGWVPTMVGAILAAGAMVATRCVAWGAARRAVDLQVVLLIGAAFGIGEALGTTGAAEAVAHQLIALAGRDPRATLVVVYGMTMLFTELVSNAAAVALVFPIALATAADLGVDVRPYAIAITMAGSASFATPIGYQTNLMVLGPGGYRFGDFLRIGAPLNLLLWGLATTVIPLVWPLRP